MAHNEAIIQWLLVTILGFSALLFFRAIFGKKEKPSEGDADTPALSGIQDLLKKIIEQTAGLEKTIIAGPVPAADAGAAGAPAPPGGGADPAEMARLKSLIKAREEELNKLKSDPIGDKLRSQIDKVQELEARLKEYEILEDDIADLSLYKEENTRLKTELQKLAGSSAGVGGEDLVDQFAQAVDSTKGLETVPAPNAEGTPLPTSTDPMADFTQAVQLEKSAVDAAQAPAPLLQMVPDPAVVEAPAAELVSAPSTAAEATPPPTPAAPPQLEVVPPPAAAPEAVAAAEPIPLSVAKPVPASEGEESEGTANLFAEFSGSLDTDRVMEELVSLEKLQGEGANNALEESLDPEKMVAEASGFTKS